MDNILLEKKVEIIKNIPLRNIIESFGGIFINDTKFSHPYFNEKTPSCSIYIKNGQEKWKCFGRGVGGDAIEFVSIVTETRDFKDAINKILRNDFSYKEKGSKEVDLKKEAECKKKEEKDRKKMFAIKANSKLLSKSKEAQKYFDKRGLLATVLKFKDEKIEILFNNYKMKDGKNKSSIVYFFKGNEKKNLNSFMIMKEINSNGDKTGFKMNIRECRPILHISKVNRPILVTEGIEDAFSGKALGYDNFLSLNSTSGINKLIISMNTCREWYSNNEFELALDNDRAGRKATNDIKVFCNIASIYENGKKDSFINFLMLMKKEKDKEKDIKRLQQIFKNNERLENIKPQFLLDAIKLVNSILSENYFKDFGDFYKVKESEFVGLMQELNKKDLNELLVDNFKEKSEFFFKSKSKERMI